MLCFDALDINPVKVMVRIDGPYDNIWDADYGSDSRTKVLDK